MRRAHGGTRTRQPGGPRPTGSGAPKGGSAAPRSKSFSRSGGRGRSGRMQSPTSMKRMQGSSAPDRSTYAGISKDHQHQHGRSYLSDHREHRASGTKQRSRSREGIGSVGSVGGGSSSTHPNTHHRLRPRDLGAGSGDERDDDEWSTSGFSSHRSDDSPSIADSDDYWIEENSYYYCDDHGAGDEAEDDGESLPDSVAQPAASRRADMRSPGVDRHFADPHHLEVLAPEERALLAPPSKGELLQSRAFTPDDLKELEIAWLHAALEKDKLEGGAAPPAAAGGGATSARSARGSARSSRLSKSAAAAPAKGATRAHSGGGASQGGGGGPSKGGSTEEEEADRLEDERACATMLISAGSSLSELRKASLAEAAAEGQDMRRSGQASNRSASRLATTLTEASNTPPDGLYSRGEVASGWGVGDGADANGNHSSSEEPPAPLVAREMHSREMQSREMQSTPSSTLSPSQPLPAFQAEPLQHSERQSGPGGRASAAAATISGGATAPVATPLKRSKTPREGGSSRHDGGGNRHDGGSFRQQQPQPLHARSGGGLHERVGVEDVAAVPPPAGQLRYSDTSQRVARSRWLNLLQEEPSGATPPSVEELLSGTVHGTDLLLGRRRTYDTSAAVANYDNLTAPESSRVPMSSRSNGSRSSVPLSGRAHIPVSGRVHMPVSGRSHGPGSQLGSQHDLWLRRLAAQALGETAAEGARMMAETGRTRAAAAAAHHNHNHSHQAGSTGASIAARCGASFGGSFGSFGANAQRRSVGGGAVPNSRAGGPRGGNGSGTSTKGGNGGGAGGSSARGGRGTPGVTPRGGVNRATRPVRAFE